MFKSFEQKQGCNSLSRSVTHVRALVDRDFDLPNFVFALFLTSTRTDDF